MRARLQSAEGRSQLSSFPLSLKLCGKFVLTDPLCPAYTQCAVISRVLITSFSEQAKLSKIEVTRSKYSH